MFCLEGSGFFPRIYDLEKKSFSFFFIKNFLFLVFLFDYYENCLSIYIQKTGDHNELQEKKIKFKFYFLPLKKLKEEKIFNRGRWKFNLFMNEMHLINFSLLALKFVFVFVLPFHAAATAAIHFLWITNISHDTSTMSYVTKLFKFISETKQPNWIWCSIMFTFFVYIYLLNILLSSIHSRLLEPCFFLSRKYIF